MRQPNSTDKHSWSADILSAPRLRDRLSIPITDLYLLITHLCSLITDYCSLITVYASWCNSIANNATKHTDHSSIRAIFGIYCITKPGKTTKTQIAADRHQDWISSCSKKSGTTPKLHQNYTEIDLEWVRSALGTPLEHLEQCNSP